MITVELNDGYVFEGETKEDVISQMNEYIDYEEWRTSHIEDVINNVDEWIKE